MNFELRQLIYFTAVAEELNLRKAAERTYVSQPALSYQMTQLEERMGVKLLERDHRGVALTPAGKVLFEGARELLSRAERLERDVQEADGGGEQQFILGVVDYLHLRQLPLALKALRTQFPSLKLETLSLGTHEQVEAVLSRRIDVGFTSLPVDHPELNTRPVLSGTWAVVLPSSHRLARKKAVQLADLAGEPLILFPQRVNLPLYQWLITSLRGAGFEPEIAYEAILARLGPDLVAEGVGLWLALTYSFASLPKGVVSRPLLGLEPDGLTMGLVWHRQSRSQARRLLMEHLLAEELQMA